jgi:hypothetical protein
MNRFKIFTPSGWFSKYWGAVFSFGGLFLALFPWFLDGVNVGISVVITCIGSAISLLGSYEAKAKQFGFQAPFTNDPLGWRKAKQTYKADKDTSGSVEKDSQL